MNAQQIRWAQQHDWFVAVRDSGAVVVRNDVGAGTLQFYDFQELRAWAGY